MKFSLYKKKAYEIRKDLFEKFYLLNEGHPGSVFSILDVLIVLYYGGFVRLKKNQPIDDVIMSKGHATVGQYPILKDLKIIKKKEWDDWGKKKSILKMFGNNYIPGIKTATGSLGHGIGFATGIGYFSKKNKIKKNVYAIISEGELYEGSTWEALLLFADLKLANVTIILDVNKNIILGDPKDCLDLGNIKKKFESFGIFTKVCDAHNFKILDTEFRKLNKIQKPKCLIVNSIKGKGFKIMENKAHSHYWSPISKDRYIKSLQELREEYE
jgi:transketolase